MNGTEKRKGPITREYIIETHPDNLPSEACNVFDTDPQFKKEYEKKWDTEINCED